MLCYICIILFAVIIKAYLINFLSRIVVLTYITTQNIDPLAKYTNVEEISMEVKSSKLLGDLYTPVGIR